MGLLKIVGGFLLVLTTIGLSLSIYLGLRFILRLTSPLLCIILDIFIVYSCIALRDLLYHAKLVANALKCNDLVKARDTVQKFVGRDAERLDAPGVARAAVESVAENFVDGFLSPVFWYVIGCELAYLSQFPPHVGAVIGTLSFRVVNTLDSMVGYRNDRYLYFGRVAARLDDLMNFLPARLAVPIIATATALCNLSVANCVKVSWRDRLKHPSPNSGHAEACVAGAMNIRLGGPTIYTYGLVEKPWIGDGDPDVSYKHIYKCRILILWSGFISFCMAIITLALINSM